MRLKNIYSLIFLLILCASCTEIWDGAVKPAEDKLVVRALLTDAAEPQVVVLYTTQGYGQQFSQRPEEGATVWVADEIGQRWYFTEYQPGMYQFTSASAQPGKSYVLHVELTDGSRFESAEQTLRPVKPIDSVYAEFTEKLLDVYDADLYLQPEWVQGIELYTDLDLGGEFARRIRFENQVMFQYEVQLFDSLICMQYLPGQYAICRHIDPDDPPRMNCRTKLPLNDVVNLSLPDFDLATGNIFQHSLGFAPQKRGYYNLNFPGTLVRRVLITRQYGLTEEAFLFYRQLREQLLADNALFDPIATQITGNMRCVSDPNRIVLGLFEVAGSHSQTFVTSSEPWHAEGVWLKEMMDLSFLPQHECFLETIPPYWIFY